MNFPKLITELVAAGVKQREIAAYANCTPSAITRIKDGTNKDPHYSIASRIIKMHKLRVTRKA